MAPRKQPQGIAASDLSALHARIKAKATDYRNTSQSYTNRCHAQKKVELLVNAKVADMIAGWVEDLIDGNQANTVAAAPSFAQPDQTTMAEDQPGTEAHQWDNADESELPDQDAGRLDL